MKTKKNNTVLSIFFMLVLFLGFTVAISSCSSDGEDESSPALVGTWINTDNSYTEIWNIGKDGSWNETSIDSFGTQYRKGTYTYDPASRTIIVSIQAKQGNNGAYTQTIFVQSLTSTTLSVICDSFGSKIFKRQ